MGKWGAYEVMGEERRRRAGGGELLESKRLETAVINYYNAIGENAGGKGETSIAEESKGKVLQILRERRRLYCRDRSQLGVVDS